VVDEALNVDACATKQISSTTSSSLSDLQLALLTGTSSGVYSHAGQSLGALLAKFTKS